MAKDQFSQNMFFSYIRVLGKEHTTKLHAWGAGSMWKPPTLAVQDHSGDVVYPEAFRVRIFHMVWYLLLVDDKAAVVLNKCDTR